MSGVGDLSIWVHDNEYIIHHMALQAFCSAKLKINASFFHFLHTVHKRHVLQNRGQNFKGR